MAFEALMLLIFVFLCISHRLTVNMRSYLLEILIFKLHRRHLQAVVILAL